MLVRCVARCVSKCVRRLHTWRAVRPRQHWGSGMHWSEGWRGRDLLVGSTRIRWQSVWRIGTGIGGGIWDGWGEAGTVIGCWA